MEPALAAHEVIELLGLEPLPGEGGMWRQTWRDDHGTAIYYLLRPGDFSALHRLSGVEVYHHYAGAPAELVVLHPDGRTEALVLGDDLVAGERPVSVVPGGAWQGSRTLGAWTLLGTTMAPPYTDEGFELAHRHALLERYPGASAHINALTRLE